MVVGGMGALFGEALVCTSLVVAAGTAFVTLMRMGFATPSTFACPLCPFLPAMGVVVNGYLLAQCHWEAWLRLGLTALAVIAGYLVRAHQVVGAGVSDEGGGAYYGSATWQEVLAKQSLGNACGARSGGVAMRVMRALSASESVLTRLIAVELADSGRAAAILCDVAMLQGIHVGSKQGLALSGAVSSGSDRSSACWFGSFSPRTNMPEVGVGQCRETCSGRVVQEGSACSQVL